jgi:type II secretory pathway pseudopilin PulG
MLGAVLLVFASNAANNHLARSRAETLIAAIKAFKQQNQRFPTKLDELVPDFIDHVPAAKYILFPPFGCFHYMGSPDSHSLMYTAFPPFGRPYYQFEEGKWRYMD